MPFVAATVTIPKDIHLILSKFAKSRTFALSLMTVHVRDSLPITRMSRSSKSLRLPAVIRRNSDMRSATGVSICL